MMETTGDRIKKYREALGLTQEELAAKISTSPQNIYKYEKGIIRNIPLGKIQALSDIFGITPTQLVGWGNDSYAQLRHSSPRIKAMPPVEITTLSEDEKTLITLYRQGSPEYQVALLNLLKAKSQYETKREPERAINPLSLKLASTMPEYKFRKKNDNK